MEGNHAAAYMHEGDFGTEFRVEVHIDGFIYELLVTHGGRDEKYVSLGRSNGGVHANLYREGR
jgi:hypothetical protein